MWNSREWLEKISETNSRGGVGGGILGGCKKVKILISGGGGGVWLLNSLFISFSKHEIYLIMNICV